MKDVSWVDAWTAKGKLYITNRMELWQCVHVSDSSNCSSKPRHLSCFMNLDISTKFGAAFMFLGSCAIFVLAPIRIKSLEVSSLQNSLLVSSLLTPSWVIDVWIGR